MAESLGSFELQVLAALHQLRPEAYGVPVRQRLEQALGRTVSVGALYTTLERLERKGLISSRRGEPTAERGGRAKRYFRIEATGATAMARARAAHAELWASDEAGAFANVRS